MTSTNPERVMFNLILLTCIVATPLFAQTGGNWVAQTAIPQAPTQADILRGEYGRYRANNDLLAYNLDIRVDPSPLKKDDFAVATDLYYIDVKKS